MRAASLNRHALTWALLSICLVTGPAFGQAQGRGRGGPLGPVTEPTPPRNPARHQEFLDIAAAGNIDLLFVGDSITDWWARAGAEVWDQYFVRLNAANFGIAGDTTQGVLWRMRNGELDGFEARLIVLMLGTNNINRNSEEDIVTGDRLILQEFRARQPQAKILLLGIFPRGEDASNPYRRSIAIINQGLARLADDERVFYEDIGTRFLQPDGTLPADIMPDGLHPNAQGYQIWADAIIDSVHELLE